MTNESGLAMTLQMREQQLQNALDLAALERGRVRELAAALRDVIGWVPGREVWHTNAAEDAVTRARSLLAKVSA